MRFLSLIVLSVFVLSTATACHSTDSASRAASSSTPATSGTPKKAPATAPPADGVRRITPAEAQDLISKGQAVVIDVRNETAFNTGHVRGAKLIPYDQVASRLKEFPRDKTIITYCSWPNEHTSAGAVLELKKDGIGNAAALLGGMEGWRNAGLPVDSVK